jgi:hypothetical protein
MTVTPDYICIKEILNPELRDIISTIDIGLFVTQCSRKPGFPEKINTVKVSHFRSWEEERVRLGSTLSK